MYTCLFLKTISSLSSKSKMAFAFLLCCFLILDACSSVRSCLQCDQVVRYIHEDFLSSVRMTVRDQIELKEIIQHAYVNYRETSRSFRGVVGDYSKHTTAIAICTILSVKTHLDQPVYLSRPIQKLWPWCNVIFVALLHTVTLFMTIML